MKKFENFLKLHKILPKVTLPINKELLVTTCKSLIEILEDTLVNVGTEENNIIIKYVIVRHKFCKILIN